MPFINDDTPNAKILLSAGVNLGILTVKSIGEPADFEEIPIAQPAAPGFRIAKANRKMRRHAKAVSR